MLKPMNYAQHKGFGFIEILVALLVISIGLLGLMVLQTKSLQFNNSSLQRTQAMILVTDIMDRMRANRLRAISTNDYVVSMESTPTASTDCESSTSTCSPSEMARHDVKSWREKIAAALPDGQGSIVRANDQFTITVRFSEYDSEDADDDVDTLDLSVRTIL